MSDTTTTKTPRTRQPTFTLEAMQEVVAKAVAEAEAKMQARLDAMQATKPSAANGKSQASMQNEIAVVKAFRKAGFGNVTPHVDVKTFSRWMMDGLRPVEGSNSIRVKNLRLFHRSQVRPLTPEEKASTQEQQQADVARHKGGKVAPIETSPQ